MLPKSFISFIFHFIKKQMGTFILLFISFAILSISDSVSPYLMKQIINTLQFYHGARMGIYAALSGTLLFLALLWISSELFLRIQGFAQIYTFPRFRANIREEVFSYVTSHSHDYFATHFAGNIAKKIADLPMSCQYIVEMICSQLVVTSVGTIVILVLMWLTNAMFAIILLIWLFLHLTIVLIFFRYCSKLSIIHSESVSNLSGKIVDTFTNIFNVKLFARTEYELEYMKKFQKDEILKAKKTMSAAEIMRMFLGLNRLLLIFGMIFALLYGWTHFIISIGDFTQILMQSLWLLGWVWFISFQAANFAREKGNIENSLAMIRKSPDILDKFNSKVIKIISPKITFEHVFFSYHKNNFIFKDLSVTIPAGKKIGLVGFSGSGKSTFINLILRFYDLNSGRILINDDDISDLTQDSLRSQIAMIPQESTLFHRSLMENIRYGRLDASEDEIIQASKLAHCHEFIEKLPKGYETLVGERGTKLSGGQRQRIIIARAILKNSPILILDEATSSLDSVTENFIKDSLHTLMQGKTTLVVAHRLSTLSDMDKILVFHQGVIVEEGTQDELLKEQGYFAMLWKMQNNGFLP